VKGEIKLANITEALVNEHKLIKRMINVLEKNSRKVLEESFSDYNFFLDAVDFIRNYADRFHHAKEEDILFTAMFDNGMPRENSPVAAMLMEHDQGRAYVKKMEEAAKKSLNGGGAEPDKIVENAFGYIELLREHIDKEDNILYPLAERTIPEALRKRIIAGYQNAEAKTPADFKEKYLTLVKKYEQTSSWNLSSFAYFCNLCSPR